MSRLRFRRFGDAINDPLIGFIIDSDKHAYKRNKFLQYIWTGSIGLTVGVALCFIPIPDAPVVAKISIFVAGYVIWDLFTLLPTCHMVLG